jgi:hypothetical protein
MPDYNQGKIYKIINDVNGMTYYGSTVQTLSMRMTKHRSDYKKKISKTYESFGNIDDCKIFLVELYPCNLKIELGQRERYFIENNQCVNKCIPTQTIQEYRLKNKEKINEQEKKYYELNKEKINEQEKKYRQVNKEKISEKKKEYYQLNKEKYKEKIKEKHDCECGVKYTIGHKSRHLKTKKHLNYINQIQQ